LRERQIWVRFAQAMLRGQTIFPSKVTAFTLRSFHVEGFTGADKSRGEMTLHSYGAVAREVTQRRNSERIFANFF